MGGGIIFCRNCGHQSAEASRFCEQCGGELRPALGTVGNAAVAASQNGKRRVWLWITAGALAVLAVVVVGVVALLVYIAEAGPGTSIITGAQIPERFLSQIRNLGVLEEGERIRYFYSDAAIDIEDGFYLLTDRKVVVYSSAYEVPAILIPFSQIGNVEVEFNESFWADGEITLTLEDGTVVSFPISSDGGKDKKFYEALNESWEAEKGIQNE